MGEFVDRILEYFRGRKPRSPFYKILFYSYIVCNWKMLYLAFWQNGEIFFKSQGSTKYEYLTQNYGLYNTATGIFNLSNLFFMLICPLLLTGLIIWVFPWITKKALKQHLKNTGSEKLAIENDQKEQRLKKEQLDIEIKDKEIENIDKDKELYSKNNQEFINDYKKFVSSKSYKDALESFSELIMRIDHHNGDLGYLEVDNDKYLDALSDVLITIYLSYGLIEKDGYRYILTTKGIYFKSLFVEKGLLKELKYNYYQRVNNVNNSGDISVEDIPF